MLRYVCLGFLAMLMALVSVNTSVVGQDKVERRDRKTDKNVIISGKLKDESMAGLKVIVGGTKEEVIPAGDIQRIFYDDMPLALKQAYYNLWLNEEKEKDIAKILKDYQEFQGRVAVAGDVRPPIKRYLDYRITMLKVAGAETEEQKGDARRALEAFAAANTASWEYAFAARALARMHLEKLDYDSALKLLNNLAGNPNSPPDIRHEAESMLIEVMFQANKTDEVRTKINAALNDAKTTEAQKSRYRIYLIGLEGQSPDAKIQDVVKKLDEVIAKAPDSATKALAYNVMGDCYMQKQLPRDAMWSYLWVDVVYSQDKGEHLKAITKLLNYFESEKDPEKVQLYKEKLSRLK